MTKISIFGWNPSEIKEPKEIQFLYYLDNIGMLKPSQESQKPNQWQNVQLFHKSELGQYDVIIAWNNNNRQKCVFLGKWNSGIIK